MQPIRFLAVPCLLLVGAATAAAAPPPAWCTGGDDKPIYNVKTLYSETDVTQALRGLVAASCYPDSDLANQDKQVAATRAAWSKKLGLVDADWGDVSAWAHLPTYLRDPNIPVTNRSAAWSAYSPIDQYGALVHPTGSVDAAYLADAFGAGLTQVGQLGYALQCLEASAKDPAVAYAMCAADVAALDATKLTAEIRADKTHSAGERMITRLVAYDFFTTKRPKYMADTKALRDKDPTYDKLFGLGATAAQQWAAVDARWVALATSLDAARITGSRSASAGCTAKAWEAWSSVVGGLSAKQLGDIHAVPGNGFLPQVIAQVIMQPNGYLAALAWTECATLEGTPDYLSRAIGNAIARWPGFRGPRTAAQTLMLTAGLQLDDRNASLDYPEVNRDWIRGDGNVENFGFGALESVTVEDERATVTFAKQKITQTRCTKGHDTSRISQIMSDGTVVYYYVCDTEITETIEVAPSPPMKVAARYAAGLKKGMTVSVTDDVVTVAYPKSKTAPALVTGVDVK